MDEVVSSAFDVRGRRVILTGATGALGRVLAFAFARAGASLCLVSRSAESLTALQRELPGDHLVVAADVSKEHANETVVAAVIDRLGGLDAWIGNTGLSSLAGSPDSYSVTKWRRMLDVNLTGTFLGCRAAAAAMAPGGSIVITSSALARRPMKGLSAYATSKAGLEAMTAAFALDFADASIRVNAVAPGWFDSPMASPFQRDPAKAERILASTAQRRWGRPEDLPGAYLFLVSQASSFVTGSVVAVDGGYLLG